MDSLVMKAILFTVAAYGLPLILGWWLYLSRAPRPGARILPPARQAALTAALLGGSGASMWIGGYWDAAEHLKTGLIPAGSDFLWPPHLMLYGSFLVALLVAVWGFRHLAAAGRLAGVTDPRLWVRQNPLMGGVAVASLYAILSIPGDAIWHELFGRDLTAWSPPHVVLGLAVLAVNLSAAALLRSVREQVERPDLVDLGVAAILAVGLNVALLVGVSEWELSHTLSDLVLARPIWLYPLVSLALSLVVAVLGQHLLPARYGATIVVMLALALRLGMTAALGAVGYPMPAVPLLALGGALAIDLHPWRSRGAIGYLEMAVAFTVGFALLSVPMLWRSSYLPPFETGDLMALLLLGSGLGALMGALAHRLARRMHPGS